MTFQDVVSMDVENISIKLEIMVITGPTNYRKTPQDTYKTLQGTSRKRVKAGSHCVVNCCEQS